MYKSTLIWFFSPQRQLSYLIKMIRITSIPLRPHWEKPIIFKKCISKQPCTRCLLPHWKVHSQSPHRRFQAFTSHLCKLYIGPMIGPQTSCDVTSHACTVAARVKVIFKVSAEKLSPFNRWSFHTKVKHPSEVTTIITIIFRWRGTLSLCKILQCNVVVYSPTHPLCNYHQPNSS